MTHAPANSISSELESIIAAALRGELTEALARQSAALGVDAVVAVMLAASGRIAQLQTGNAPATGPHTPSGAIPPYAKANASAARGNAKPGKPGARDGHTGHRRPAPTVDRREDVEPLTLCPECNGEVLPARKRRTRVVEDIKPDNRAEAVEYTIGQHWCACCKKHVEPGVAAAMPGAAIGNGLVALSTVMHYGLGLTIDQTREIFASHLQTELSPGGLVDLWRRAGEALLPWYQQIGNQAKTSARLHADETSWRVEGDTHWLWCFCNHANCYYLIDESRGSDVLNAFFTEAFSGVLMSDFWGPYQSVVLAAATAGDDDQQATAGGARQACLVHLLRELKHISADVLPGKSPPDAREWTSFAAMLKRLLKDGIRLRRQEDFDPQRYGRRITLIDKRLIMLAEANYDDPDARRLAKRLSKHRDEIFTFLDRPEASWENNFAERQIRPAVILRKNSQCNRSQRGAATQAVLMSIYRTLKLRGLDPRSEIERALRAWSATGTLPPLPLPAATVAVGIG